MPLGHVRCTLDYPPGHGSAQDALRYPPAPLPGVVTDFRAVVIAVPPPRRVQTRCWTRFGRVHFPRLAPCATRVPTIPGLPLPRRHFLEQGRSLYKGGGGGDIGKKKFGKIGKSRPPILGGEGGGGAQETSCRATVSPHPWGNIAKMTAGGGGAVVTTVPERGAGGQPHTLP